MAEQPLGLYLGKCLKPPKHQEPKSQGTQPEGPKLQVSPGGSRVPNGCVQSLRRNIRFSHGLLNSAMGGKGTVLDIIMEVGMAPPDFMIILRGNAIPLP